ncbi:MAG: hypothetical protein JRF22_04270 [Deltaproteobacteria bacterium]|nr:hypothetical protein [Deltaproteobacteria bacterium]
MIEYKNIIIACTILTISLTPFFSCKKKKSEFKFPHIPAIYGNNLSKVIAFDVDNILLLGTFGYAAKTTKGSQIRFENSKKHFWEVQDTGLSEALLTDASFPDSQHGWAVGITGIVIHTADGGKTWKRQESGTENHLFTVYFADTQNGWAAGDLMTVIHTADGGKTWESQEAEEILEENIFAAEVIYNGLYFHDAYEGWMVGEFGTIYHTTDGGKNWKHQSCDLLQPDVAEDGWELPRLTIYDIYFTDRNRGFILGVDGTLLKTEDGGKEWKKIDSATEQSLYSISVVGDKCWAVGNTMAAIPGVWTRRLSLPKASSLRLTLVMR